MLQRTEWKHVKYAVHAMAYGASHSYTRHKLMHLYRLPARKAASAIKWAEFILYTSYN